MNDTSQGIDVVDDGRFLEYPRHLPQGFDLFTDLYYSLGLGKGQITRFFGKGSNGLATPNQ